MANLSLANASSTTTQIEGITELRQRTIAALLARGFSVKYVAKKLKMSKSRIYHLLSDKDSLVNAEINRILNELFASSDRRLMNLYEKALQRLDAMLSSPDEEKQYRAIDSIIKIYFRRSAKNAITIQQYFGVESQQEEEGEPETIDEMLLRMRKERGLPLLPDDDLPNLIAEMRKVQGLPELPHEYIQDVVSKLLNEQGLPELLDHKDSFQEASPQDVRSPDGSP